MKVEEALKEIFVKSQEDKSTVEEAIHLLVLYGTIEKIYNDFESRTCESCKHSEGYIIKCDKGIEMLEDFSCNKWELQE